MGIPETAIHSFVVRIWLEEMVEETGQLRWRGHITHVPSNQRQYIEDLDEIKQFIARYLQIPDDGSNPE